jgi:hypothetical protein
VQIEVFDPAMCCSTGVCGPSVDPALAKFAADLDWLASTGSTVRRFNLGQEPAAFAENLRVRALLTEQGESALPVIFADGELRASGRIPAREELAAWASVEVPGLRSDELAVDAAGLVGSTASTVGANPTSAVATARCCAPGEAPVGDSDASACFAASEPVALSAKPTDVSSCC